MCYISPIVFLIFFFPPPIREFCCQDISGFHTKGQETIVTLLTCVRMVLLLLQTVSLSSRLLRARWKIIGKSKDTSLINAISFQHTDHYLRNNCFSSQGGEQMQAFMKEDEVLPSPTWQEDLRHPLEEGHISEWISAVLMVTGRH